MSDRICVSEGNTKLGQIPSISLMPLATCNPAAPCVQRGCRIRRLLPTRPAYKESLVRNTNLAYCGDYWEQLAGWFATQGISQPAYFRFHVAGDVPNLRYFRHLIQFVSDHPTTQFLMFSKQYSLVAEVRHAFPANLHVVLSAWPGFPIDNPHKLPVAWVAGKRLPDPRVPRDAIPCGGTCQQCGLCWCLESVGKDVVFKMW